MRVLVVEDHPLMRQGVINILNLLGSAEIVGEAETAYDAVGLAALWEPEVVVMDLGLKGAGTGIEACREIKAMDLSPNGPPKVLIHTAYDSQADLASARLAGADGYVHKSVEPRTLVEAVEKTFAGERVWYLGHGDPEEAGAAAERVLSASGAVSLTEREREVVALVMSHRTNPEIAKELHVSVRTVKNHVSSIMRKMGLKSRRDICP